MDISIHLLLIRKNNFYGPINSGMGIIDMQPNSRKPMKKSRDIYEIFKKISKLSTKNIKILSQKKKVDETFSPSQDMTKYMGKTPY